MWSSIFDLFYGYNCQRIEEDEEKCIEDCKEYKEDVSKFLEDNEKESLNLYTCALRNKLESMNYNYMQECLNLGIRIGMEIKEMLIKSEEL